MKRIILNSSIFLLLISIFIVSCKTENIEDMNTAQSQEEALISKAEADIQNSLNTADAFGKQFNNANARSSTPTSTIVEIAVASPLFKSLVAAVVKTGLAPTLSSASLNATVFAPTDAAFAKLPAPFNNAKNISAITNAQQIETLKTILLYHVLGTEVKRANIPAGKTAVATLKPVGSSLDNVIYISNQNRLLTINGRSLITITDIDASNGVIHVIDNVLQFPSQNIAEIAIGNAGLTTLVAALVKTNLAGVFTGKGDFTVFAPTNAAFAHLPAPFNNAANINAITNKTQIDALSNILRYHVVSNRNFTTDLGNRLRITTLADAPNNTVTTISAFSFGLVRGDGNRLFSFAHPANILATNGVIHVIDQVLLPK